MHKGRGKVQREWPNEETTCNERDVRRDGGCKEPKQEGNDLHHVQVHHHAGTPWDQKRKWQQGSNTCIIASVEAQGTHLGRISTLIAKETEIEPGQKPNADVATIIEET